MSQPSASRFSRRTRRCRPSRGRRSTPSPAERSIPGVCVDLSGEWDAISGWNAVDFERRAGGDSVQLAHADQFCNSGWISAGTGDTERESVRATSSISWWKWIARQRRNKPRTSGSPDQSRRHSCKSALVAPAVLRPVFLRASQSCKMTGTVTISLLVLILLGAMLFLLPYLHAAPFLLHDHRRCPDFQRAKPAAPYRAAYHVQIAGVLVVSLLAVFAFSGAAMVWAELLLALGGAAAFLYARSKVPRYSPEAVAKSSSLQVKNICRDGFLWALPPFLFLPAAAAWLRAHWSEIPVRFPYHWNAHGEPDSWTMQKRARRLWSAALLRRNHAVGADDERRRHSMARAARSSDWPR